MSKIKWLILIAVGMAVCVTTVAIVLIVFMVWTVGLGNILWSLGLKGVDRTLPVYTIEQVPSAHPGYRRTTVTSGNTVYVNDYEEYPLLLQNQSPTNAVGRMAFGNAKICSIAGQPPTAYLAVDAGSEMPAYEVFRNIHQPPFDWRHATFQKMEFTGQIGRTEHKRATDPVLIDDFVRTLREGTFSASPALTMGSISNLAGVLLSTDQLPGLVFCPYVYRDPAGPVYLLESFVMESSDPKQQIRVRWTPASPLFAKWVETP
ncbi:MAG: hypothetical protein ABSG14_11310 [Verrucomicrobiia bacterium]|jgi:hypothetical protein